MNNHNESMRVVNFNQYGGPEVLALQSASRPEPGKGQVRVEMKGLALNRSNSLFRSGNYIFGAQFPSRIGTEGTGIIDALGEGVTGFKLGQRVNLLQPQNESERGLAADFNVVAQETLLPSPPGLNDRQAATAWVPYLTLYNLFVEQGLAAKGKWVVLPAASSSVSLAANNLAHYLGAKTIGLTRTLVKAQALKEAGYDAVVISETDDVSARILEITGEGADFVFDPVGGSGLEKLISSVKRGAIINVYGVLAPGETVLPIFALMNSGATLSAYNVYELASDPVRMKAAIEYFAPLFDNGKLVPTVDPQHFSLDQIVDAFTHLESNNQFGKVVIEF
jgi:NADPH:quinone reductase-like Zn-dependent oxidoreductase